MTREEALRIIEGIMADMDTGRMMVDVDPSPVRPALITVSCYLLSGIAFHVREAELSENIITLMAKERLLCNIDDMIDELNRVKRGL